jgi:hypothetical protein
MGPLLWVIVVGGTAFLAVIVYMEWTGVMSLVSPRGAARYDGCRHIRALPMAAVHDTCWACRHRVLRHPLHAAHFHHPH